MDTILTFLTGSAGSWLLGLIGAVSIGALMDKILKKYITEARLDHVRDRIADCIAWPGDKIGLAMNKAGTQLPILGKMWNKTLEPWVIIILRTVVSGFIEGFRRLLQRIIKALQSDNPSTRV